MLIVLVASVGASLNFLPAGGWSAHEPITFSGRTMGTNYIIKIVRLPQNTTLDDVQRNVYAASCRTEQ